MLTRLGPYEIIELIGEGGMGTVYRARDPRLDRVVALKVLRSDAAGDPDRQARFVKEAKSVSSLNHPNIVTVHDVGVDDGVSYMAMEYVEGQSLEQLIPPRGMRVTEGLRIASQVADAFAEAHARKIVHRDLKPANVMVQPNGRVKVLDFGLAKLIEDAVPDQNLVTQTAAGVIVGTAAYMSPEQAEGKPLDPRSDVFSFGALLYEMCSGKRAFQGESNASVLAEVLRQEPPPLQGLRAELPAELTRLVMRCLRKDPARRVQSMADLKVAFDELRDEIDSGKLASGIAPAAVSARKPWMAAAVAAAVAAIVVASYFVFVRGAAGPEAAAALLQPLPLTAYTGPELDPNLSPDGKSIAFAWTGEPAGSLDIYVQLIGAGVPLRLTQSPAPESKPQWSPDGRYIAFLRRLARERVAVLVVPALGGAERQLVEFSTRLLFDQTLSALAWTPDGKYLLASGGRNLGDPSAIHVVSVESGEVRTIITADGMDGYYPMALSPDGRTLAAVRNRSGAEHSTQLFHLTPEWSVDGPPIDTSITGEVLTITWTPDSRELIYRPGVNTQLPLYRVAVPDGVPTPMAWVGADAQSATISGAAKRLVYTRFARDTNIWRLAVDSAETGAPVLDQLPSSSFRDVFPQYSPDGKRLVFYSNRSGSIQIWTSTADGNSANQLTNMDPLATTGSPRWSPDGRRIVFDSNAGGRYQLYEVSADGGPARAIVADASNNFTGAWSPDGKWLYFSSDRSGRLEVWRQSGGGGAAEQVTKNGGSSPTISPDSAWLYFVKGDGAQGLWRIALGGGEESIMVDTIFRYAYVVTPSAIYYMLRGVPNVPGVLRKLDLATGRSKDLLVLDKLPDLGLAMSPDSRYLLFCKIDYAGADLMLVENFR